MVVIPVTPVVNEIPAEGMFGMTIVLISNLFKESMLFAKTADVKFPFLTLIILIFPFSFVLITRFPSVDI